MRSSAGATRRRRGWRGLLRGSEEYHLSGGSSSSCASNFATRLIQKENTMKGSKKILNLLSVGLDSELARKAVAAGYTLTKLRRASRSELAQHFGDRELDLISEAIKRKRIPEHTLQRLIEECDLKCCLCWNYREEPPIIIHHIEEHSKTADDSYDNLVILCLNHHAKAHSKWEISRHPWPPELIRTKKREWIEAVAGFKAGRRPAPGSEVADVHQEQRLREKQKKRNALCDFLANDAVSLGGLVVWALWGINVASIPVLAKRLDELIRKTQFMEMIFITDREARKAFARMGELGRLTWEQRITEERFEQFREYKEKLENVLVSLEEELLG